MKAISVGIITVLICANIAFADNPAREAGKHFQRGVELYTDGDFRGALVEFKKAYAVWPRANVLYDIGQAEYQLLDYAAALKTMDRYLAETGPNAAHRSEVEATAETLRGRVGRIALTTDAVGCDVLVDDQPAGSTPIDTVLTVSVGSRKIAINCSGRAGALKHVEVAAGELVRVQMELPAPPVAAVRGLGAPPVEKKHYTSRASWITGWAVTGVLLAGTIGVGAGALVEEQRLSALKLSYPVTKSALDSQSAVTTGLAVTADVLGVATIVAAGVSTYLTVKYDREKKLRVGISGRGVSLSANF